MLELFQFHISNSTSAQPESFHNGFGSSRRDCGRITATSSNKEKELPFRSSCDVLDSGESPLYNGAHSTLSSIYLNCQQIRSRIDQAELTKDENKVRNEWAATNRPSILQCVKTLKAHYKQDLVDNSILQSNYIRTLSIKPSRKVILIGDLHGSMHTLLRHMFRFAVMGILNITTMKLKKQMKLIFLGDAVDRGIGSLEVLAIIFKLMEVNINQVYYNRGNHETKLINQRDGLKSELRHRNVLDLYNPINDFFDLLPCAIVLKLENKKVWICHGAFERRYVLRENRLNFKEAFVPIDIDSTDTIGTMWHDFQDGGNVQSDRGEFIVNYDRYDLTKFLDNNGLDFIIRGHQDFFNNSFLFGPNFHDGTTELNGYGLNYSQTTRIYGKEDVVHFNLQRDSINSNQVYGSIATVSLDKRAFFKETGDKPFYFANVDGEYDIHKRPMVVFPCLTLSTNTDHLRYLNFDSFAILS